MNRHKKPVPFLFVPAVVCILLLFLFRPAYVSIDLDGVQMQSDGTLMLDRKITLKGWHLSPLFGEETIKITKLRIEGFGYSLPRQAASPVFPHTDGVCFADCALLTRENVPVSCDFMWSETKDFLLIHMDGYFFAADKNEDCQKILDIYQSLISISQ